MRPRSAGPAALTLVIAAFAAFFTLAPIFTISSSCASSGSAGSKGGMGGMVGMVVTSHPLATDVGVKILRGGGNAVDAAVAVAFALSIVEPWNTGVGGGTFILVRMKDGRTAAIDGREKAPRKASRNMYLDQKGEPTSDSRTGPRAIGVPGTAAALALARDQYGSMSWSDLMAPSIKLAEEGFPVGERMAAKIARSRDRLEQFSEWARIYLVAGKPPAADHTLRQKDLAASYRVLAREGPSALYGGALGRAMVTNLAAVGGIISLEDLRDYKAVVRKELRGTYRGYEVLGFPPPAGGTVVIETLNLLEPYDLSGMGAASPAAVHIVAEALKLSFADRAAYLGDPDAVKVPTAVLVSKAYAKKRGSGIMPKQASPVAGKGDPFGMEGENTTHFSVVDRAGNAVSVTQTLNLPFGSGIVPRGTGIVLNDQMDDFSAKPGSPNAFGLVGAEANAIAPGKRPLSSMSPTILLSHDSPLLVLGSPGGPRIITAVLETILNIVDFNMDVQEAVDALRFHHQWKPDMLAVEEGTDEALIAGLRERGHKVMVMRPWSSVQAIRIDPATKIRRGGSDRRSGGKAAGE